MSNRASKTGDYRATGIPCSIVLGAVIGIVPTVPSEKSVGRAMKGMVGGCNQGSAHGGAVVPLYSAQCGDSVGPRRGTWRFFFSPIGHLVL